MPTIHIVTDSTCDLPAEFVQRHNIHIVPTYVQFGVTSLADDGVQLTRDDFYRRLVSGDQHPTTSAPPLGQTIEIMQSAIAHADFVIGLTAPSTLSGIYNIFRLAAEKVDPQRITLIDSQNLSMGLGWQIMVAAQMAEAGKMPDEIARHLAELQPRVDLWAALDTFEYLRRSGRVGWAAATLGEALRIKPIIRVNQSQVSSVRRVRTTPRAFNGLVEIATQAAPFSHLAIVHTQNLDGARQLAQAIDALWPDSQREQPPFIVEVTPVLGVHVGPGGLGLAGIRQTN